MNNSLGSHSSEHQVAAAVGRYTLKQDPCNQLRRSIPPCSCMLDSLCACRCSSRQSRARENMHRSVPTFTTTHSHTSLRLCTGGFSTAAFSTTTGVPESSGALPKHPLDDKLLWPEALSFPSIVDALSQVPENRAEETIVHPCAKRSAAAATNSGTGT